MSKDPFQQPKPSVFGLLKQKKSMVGGAHQEPDNDESRGTPSDNDADNAPGPRPPKLKQMLMRKPRKRG